jgi:ADP-ribose pyrophosphatase YjhB (NUDIX family)
LRPVRVTDALCMEHFGESCRERTGSYLLTMGRARRPALHATHQTTVVRALARRGDRVLMLRRAVGDSFGGCWELAGGKVDERGGVTERPVVALRREFREESGLELVGEPELIATAQRVSPNGRQMTELTFVAEVSDGEPTLSDEHDAAGWHSLDDAPGELTDAASDGLAALRALA